ncbi:TetR/AcrR family transcriptional regulator [Massilia sp. IC2-476]|uniref:TetR/AcrR family transcriptional regulator n=1 Tax=Massilia sp. IC2-476 TaxID=2887199 RepID=UPI001D127F88|nr:TetR/AcrR family transcriptional regulator [Massilia sp. IC2-476]MCC2971284.1 TetR/AcrR family transcriptional regulator [Massilia sp. IC2-476]
MPYSSEHKAQTRERIVSAARRLFNRHGFEQVSIDRVMLEAGLTRGGFYHHFGSKDELYAAAVASFTNCNPFRADLESNPMPAPGELARMLLDVYLSDKVFDNVDFHCPLYALPGDVARAGLSPQKAYTQLIRNLTAVYASALAGVPDGEQRAQAIVSLCVGGMVLARTTDDPVLRRSLRAAARRQALALLSVASDCRAI